MKTTSEGTEFVSKIKEARIKHGLTIRQVESLTGVPYRSLQNWELGVRKCPDYVEKMVVDIINHNTNLNHQTFLEVLVVVLHAEAEKATCEETKECVERTIKAINKHLNK